jgi:hypothetical protein
MHKSTKSGVKKAILNNSLFTDSKLKINK